MFRRVWKVLEAKVGKVGMTETERRRGKRGSRKEKEKGKKQIQKKWKREKTIEVKRVAKEWEIWDEEKEAEKLEEEAKKWVSERFHKWIKVFGKKQSEQMPTRKIWDHIIEMKEGFVPRTGKVYPLSREEREEVHEFIKE